MSGPPTNSRAPGTFLFSSLMLLGLLAGGCASPQKAWERTKSTVQSAYVQTRKSIAGTLISISEYQRRSAQERQPPGKAKGATDASAKAERKTARGAAAPHFQDRFPSRVHPPREETLRPGKPRRTAPRTTRGAEARETLAPPHSATSPAEWRQRIREVEQKRIRSGDPAERRRLDGERKRLERLLLRSQREENIIEQMGRLRRRLRKLQKDLLHLQQEGR